MNACLPVVLLMLLITSCNNKKPVAEKPMHYLSESSLNMLHVGDTAVISVSYPQGTAYYQYQLEDSAGLIEQIDHATRPGDPEEAGGPMGESFSIKAVKQGKASIRLIDQSSGARRSLEENKEWKNYVSYEILVQ